MGECLRRGNIRTPLFVFLLVLSFVACSSENDYANDINAIGYLSSESDDVEPDSTEVSAFDNIPEPKDGILYFQKPGSSSVNPSSSSAPAPEWKSSSSSLVPASSSSLMPSSSSVVPVSSSTVSSSSSSAKPESSSSLASSSSSVKSSTSGVVDEWNWNISRSKYLNPEYDYDWIQDYRDGQLYNIVKIANRWWMAQNLNYSGEEVEDESWCYGDTAQHCDVTGRLYTWAAAQVACPEGWYLPNDTEWQTMLVYAGGASIAGRRLKSQTGWFTSGNAATVIRENSTTIVNGNGIDSLGFAAIPAGERSKDGEFRYLGIEAAFWIDSEYDGLAYYAFMTNYSSALSKNLRHYKTMGFSVRCIKALSN